MKRENPCEVLLKGLTRFLFVLESIFWNSIILLIYIMMREWRCWVFFFWSRVLPYDYYELEGVREFNFWCSNGNDV